MFGCILVTVALAGCGGSSAKVLAKVPSPTTSMLPPTTTTTRPRPTTTTTATTVPATTAPAPKATAHVASVAPRHYSAPAAPAAPAAPSNPAPQPAPAISGNGSAFVGLINAFRAKHGLPPLSVHWNLVSKANSWAAHMASGGCGVGGGGVPYICHSSLSSGISVPWALLEENVGMVGPPNIGNMENGFEGSPEHAANMLNPKIIYVGVGVAYTGNYMYVAEEFMAA